MTGDIEAKPTVNTLFLGIGAVLASFMGTTGAAMLLIRPVIQTNKERAFKVHTILFFIGIVANCGGLLTPLGDPPLFMMYLTRCTVHLVFKTISGMVITNSLLLIIYFIADSLFSQKRTSKSDTRDETIISLLKFEGK